MERLKGYTTLPFHSTFRVLHLQVESAKDALLESKPAALLLEALLALSAISEAAGCEVLTRLIFSVGINFPPILLSRAMQVLCQFFGHLIV